jgi:hypothetical protein
MSKVYNLRTHKIARQYLNDHATLYKELSDILTKLRPNRHYTFINNVYTAVEESMTDMEIHKNTANKIVKGEDVNRK